LATLSAAGSVTVEPLDRAVPLSVSLQSMVALPVASILTLDTVTLRMPSSNSPRALQTGGQHNGRTGNTQVKLTENWSMKCEVKVSRGRRQRLR